MKKRHLLLLWGIFTVPICVLLFYAVSVKSHSIELASKKMTAEIKIQDEVKEKYLVIIATLLYWQASSAVFILVFFRVRNLIKDQRTAITNAGKLSSIGELAASIAHEINNPLSAISARAEVTLTQLRVGKLDQKKIEDSLEKVIKMSFRIGKIVRGLLNFSRDATNDPFLETPVLKIIEESLELCRMKTDKFEIELRMPSFEDVEVRVRSVQISQVLVNLINNSIHALEKLPEKWIEILVQPSAEKVTISVTDSGSGISAEVAKKLMQPFFTTKELGKGTGLGLSISRHIIEAHGGRFHLDQKCPNTRFVIELPLASSAESRKIAA